MCLFKKYKNKCYVIVYLYVNDILILDKMNTWSFLSNILNNKFDIKDLDVANIIKHLMD
jgi:hypothetical protein